MKLKLKNWAWLGLLLPYLFTRLVKLTLIPVFADEAIYIHWAQIAWHDATQRFIPLSDGKPPLFMWLMIPFLKVIEDPLLAGRLVSVAAGAFTFLGSGLLVKKLFKLRAAVFMAVLLVSSPFLLFYDRLALTDSLLTAWAVWSFWLGLTLVEEPKRDVGIILGTVWGLALLTKPTAGYFPLLTPLFIWLFPLKKWGKKFKQLIVPAGLASLYALAIYNILRLSPGFHMISRRSLDYLRSRQEIRAHLLDYFWGTTKVMLGWLNSWLGWPVMVFLAVTLVWAWRQRQKKIGLLFIWAAAPFIVQAVIGKIIYPRYLLFTLPFLLAIVAWGLAKLAVVDKRLAWLVLVVLLFKPLVFDYWLIVDPAKAGLHRAEREQYLEEWSAGYGIKPAAEFLKQRAEEAEKIVVGTEGFFGTLPDGLEIYLAGEENIQVIGLAQPLKELDSRLKAASLNQPTYLLVNSTRLEFESPQLELIKAFPKPVGPKGQESLLFFRVKQP